jgi:hypothetical protein
MNQIQTQMAFNPPKMPPAPAQQKIQVLDQDALEYIKAEKPKKTYEQICDYFTGLGYTRPNGRNLNALEVSKFACENGFRQNAKAIHRKRTNGVEHVYRQVPSGLKVLTNDDFNEMVEMRNKGMGTNAIAEAYRLRGYTTITGGKIWGCDISKFLVKRGARKNRKFSKQTGGFTQPKAPAQITEPRLSININNKVSGTDAEKFIETVVMTSPLLTMKQKMTVANSLLT